MFNIFQKIKQLIMKIEQLDQQLTDAISVAQKLGTENKELRTTNETLKANNAKLLEDFNSAVDRVRYLDNQLKMKEAQETAVTRFNDTSKNY